MAKIEVYDDSGDGEVVFYAHGSESMRTYLGLSKFHTKPDCVALKRRGSGGNTVVQDRVRDVSPKMRCKLCNPVPKPAA